MMKGCKGFVTNLQVLNQYTLGNQMPFMAKELSKVIMKRARLVKIFLRNGMEENKFFVIGKGITLYLFCKNLREDTIKT